MEIYFSLWDIWYDIIQVSLLNSPYKTQKSVDLGRKKNRFIWISRTKYVFYGLQYLRQIWIVACDSDAGYISSWTICYSLWIEFFLTILVQFCLEGECFVWCCNDFSFSFKEEVGWYVGWIDKSFVYFKSLDP